MILNPKQLELDHLDHESAKLVASTVEFFESKGKRALKTDDHNRVWYQDFLDFQAQAGLFATALTPSSYGEGAEARWDTNRIVAINEVLGFYGLAYWYTWQVSILGLGPIWMSSNEAAKQRAASLLRDGEIFGFGLSEKEHGADIYSSDMLVAPGVDGLSANGGKYYIGNGNRARMVSTFGKRTDNDEYIFFAADSQHPNYELIKNVVSSQSYVSQYELREYPIGADDILHEGDDAWNAALNTVNIGKFNLGWASIGISTHAFYEAITHASNRNLYGKFITEFPHVRQLLVDAYARLVAARMFARRATDYMRSASADDRRYLLFNPIVKMKVTTEGERIVDHLWDVIAAKGFEADMYFEMAARDIRALPKLEGTVHVNLALILKFAANYFFNPAEYPVVTPQHAPMDDEFLFAQGAARGLSKIQFHNYADAFALYDTPNLRTFAEQVGVLRTLLVESPPSAEQVQDLDVMMIFGELFTCVPYAQLILEQAQIDGVAADVVDQIFDVFVRDMSRYAVELHNRVGTLPEQAGRALQLIKRPHVDSSRYERVWKEVSSHSGAYEMRP